MTQLNRKLPLGIQDFEEMRRYHYIYADKTDMVWKLANGTKQTYLSKLSNAKIGRASCRERV